MSEKIKVTKIGHCCLVIDVNGKRLLTDPGTYTTGQDAVTGVQAILITHEHQDHLHIDSLKRVLNNNPEARVITNSAVGALLAKAGLPHELVEQGMSTSIGEVRIEGFGDLHADIHNSVPIVQNTGFLIAESLFYPGDAFFAPRRQVDILALPVAGPWMKLSEAIDFALRVRPKSCFPVHDGMLKHLGPVHRVPAQVLEKHSIRFIVIADGTSTEF